MKIEQAIEQAKKNIEKYDRLSKKYNKAAMQRLANKNRQYLAQLEAWLENRPHREHLFTGAWEIISYYEIDHDEFPSTGAAMKAGVVVINSSSGPVGID